MTGLMGKWARMIFLGIVIIIGVVMISGCNSEELITESPSQPELVIRLGMDSNEQSAAYQGMLKFKETVEANSENRIKVKLYADGALGTEEEMLQSMKIGTVEMACFTTASIGRHIPEYKVFSLPYLFPDRNTALTILEGNLGVQYLEKLQSLKLIGLGFIDNGYLQIANTNRPVMSVNDMKGLKIVTKDLPYYSKTINAFGGNSVVYDDIQTKQKLDIGELHGVAMTLDDILAVDLHGKSLYVSKTNHIYQPMVLVIEEEVWLALSEEEKQIIQDGAKVATSYVKENIVNIEQENEKKLSEKGYAVNELTVEGRQPFISIGQGIIEKAKGEIGAAPVNGMLYAVNPSMINTEVQGDNENRGE